VSGITADLEWNQRKTTLTLDYDKGSNVFNFHLAPRYQKFQAFVAEAGLEKEENDPVVLDTYVTNDEDDESDQGSAQSSEQTSPTQAEQEDPAGHLEGVTDDQIDEPVLIDLMPEDLETSKRIVDPAEEDQ
jgi:hypothetical protein